MNKENSTKEYKVSIIVPIYNVSCYIERCLGSLFEQTFKELEYIFVNDCTKDDSISILERLLLEYPECGERATIIHHEKNKGLAAARMTGLLAAKGYYILHIDSDDYIDKRMVEVMYNKAIPNNLDIVVCDFFLDRGYAQIYDHQNIGENNIQYIHKILERESAPCVWNKLIKKELYEKNSIWPIEGINYGEDIVTTVRLLLKTNKIAKIDEALYYYVNINTSSYTKNIKEASINNILNVVRVLDDFFTKENRRDVFEKSLNIYKLRMKASMFLLCESSLRKKYRNIFDDVYEERAFLNKQERLFLFLLDNKCYMTLDIILYFASKVVKFKRENFRR